MYTQIIYLSDPKRYRVAPVLRETMSERDKRSLRSFVGVSDWPTLEQAKRKAAEVEEGLKILFMEQQEIIGE